MSRKKIHLDKKNLGHRIQMVLDYAGVGQDKAAEMLKISKQSLNRYINSSREPGIKLITQMGNIFNCNSMWIFTGEGEIAQSGTFKAAEQRDPYKSAGESPEIEELLDDARYVLTAGNALAFNALERNIKYFRHAVTVESEMKQLRAENAGIKEQLNDLQAQFVAFKRDREVSDLSSLSKKSG